MKPLAPLAVLLFALPASAQCLSDRLLAPEPGEQYGARLDVSGDWLAVGARAASGTAFTVSLHQVQPDGSWPLADSVSVATDAFSPNAVALDGDRLFVSSGPTIHGFQLQAGTWQPTGSHPPLAWSVIRMDYTHPNLIVANGDWDLSFIFLNGVARLFEVQPDGSLDTLSGFSGFPLDQQLGTSVGVTGDTLAIGAPGYDGFGKADPGFVQLFDVLSDGTVQFVQNLVDPNPVTTFTDFGQALALDDDFLAVQAPEGNGRVEVFRRELGAWAHDGSIPAPAGTSNFGAVLALDGINLVASAGEGLFASELRYFVYQRLLGQWVLRSSYDEPEDAQLFPSVGLDAQTVVTASDTYAPAGSDPGAAWVWRLDGMGCPGSITSPGSVSLSSGGTVDLLTSFAPLASGELYLVLGSASGSAPGVPFGGDVVPLVPDAWTTFTLTKASQPPLESTLGVLDVLGGALSRLNVPADSPPSLVGTSLFHATLTFDPVIGQFERVSDASSLALLP